MSFTSTPSFHKRSRQIVRRHRSIARKGGEFQMGPDGLLTMRRRRGGTGIPFRGLLLIAVLLFGTKALMLNQDGPTSYAERVARLAEGSSAERAGAWIMQADPLTVFLADGLRQLRR